MTELPGFVQIEPVGQCNLRCRMCPIQFRAEGAPGQPRAYMDVDVDCRLVDQFPTMTALHLQGLGEPLLHPRFFDMVRHAAQRGIKVSTNTNLTVMTEAGAEECINSGLHTMHVSLDGATAQTYQTIRIRSRFERVLRNLRRVVKTKRRLRSDLPHLRIVAVVMRENLEELPELVRLSHAEGVATVFVQHLCHDFGESSLSAQYQPMRSFIDSAAPTSATTARPCPAAWSPRRTASTSATWQRKASRRYGTTRNTPHSAHSSNRPIRRRKCAAAARCTQGHSDF